MEEGTEELRHKWEDIDRRNIATHNKEIKKIKIVSVVILAIMLFINGIFSFSMFMQNHPILGIVAAAFGLFLSGLYFVQTVKPSFEAKEKVYNPESNPISSSN